VKKRGTFACAPLASFGFPYFLLSLFLQHLSWGSADVLTLLVEVIQAWEAVATAEAACAVAVLVAEATATLDSAVALVKDAEDRTALIGNEARERVSRVDEESIMALASACDEIESVV
jgi:hypothetical protein